MKTKQTLQQLIVLSLFVGLSTEEVWSQVTIGSSEKPTDFSILEISTNHVKGGLRLPQLTTTERNGLQLDTIQSGVNKQNTSGLFIYNIDSKAIEYWDGTHWNRATENQWVSDPPTSSVALVKNSIGIERSAATQVAIGDYGRMIIGNNQPQTSSAALELNSVDKGLLLPRLTSSQRDRIAEPVAGLTIFNTDKSCVETYVDSARGWYNSCEVVFSNRPLPASFNFECRDITFRPQGRRIPAGPIITESNGYSLVLSYIEGNGGSLDSQTFYSTNPLGLMATLNGGVINGSLNSPGSGELVMPITGRLNSVPSSGVAPIHVEIAGRSCPINIPIGLGSIGSINSPTINTMYVGLDVSRSANLQQTVVFNYTGGDGGAYPRMNIASTSVSGLNLSIDAGAFSVGDGTLTFRLSGTPTAVGTAFFDATIGGQRISVRARITAFTSCRQIYDFDSTIPSGIYTLDLSLVSTFPIMNAQCDMTTEIGGVRGGWTLVYNYVHQANRGRSTNRTTLPVLSNNNINNPRADLGRDESNSTATWGHAPASLVRALNPSAFIIYGTTSRPTVYRTSPPNATVHFYSNDVSSIRYFTGGGGDARGLVHNHIKFPGHTATLPDNSNTFYTTRNDAIILNHFPFFRVSNNHWAANGARFDVDDWTSGQFHTIHRMWVR